MATSYVTHVCFFPWRLAQRWLEKLDDGGQDCKTKAALSSFLPFDREAILSPSTVLLYNLSIQNLVQNIFPNDFSRRVPCQLARHNAILPETEDNFCSIANKTKEKLWCQGGSNSHCCSLYFKELEIKRNTSNDLSRETEKFSQLATWYYEKRFEDTQLNYLLSTSSLKLNLPFLKNINGRQKPFVVLKRVFSENINDMKCQRIWTLFQQIL